MAYRCKNCKKIARGKKKKTASTLLKRHCCPGCGFFEFDLIEGTLDLIYDFDELAFDLMDFIDNDTFSKEPLSESSGDNTNETNESIESTPQTYGIPTTTYEPLEQTHNFRSDSSSGSGSDSSSGSGSDSSSGYGSENSSSCSSDFSNCGCD
jgi:hypothetical protein